MSKTEYNSLLFRISKRLDDINDLEHVLFICREKLEHQADQDIHNTLSLLRKLEDSGFLGVDEMQEVKDILKAVEEWDLYEKVVKFESTRREYKELLERVINVLEGFNDLERLMSTVCRVRRIPEEKKNGVQDVRSLFQVLEDMNCLGIDRLGMLKEIFTELNNDELLTELAEFQKCRIEDETRERRKGNLTLTLFKGKVRFRKCLSQCCVILVVYLFSLKMFNASDNYNPPCSLCICKRDF